MNISIDWTVIVLSVIGVVGILQYLKGWLPKAPTWVWRALLPAVCAAIAVAGGGGLWQIVLRGVVVLTFAEIGYETIVQGLTGLLKAVMEKVKAGVGIAEPPAA